MKENVSIYINRRDKKIIPYLYTDRSKEKI